MLVVQRNSAAPNFRIFHVVSIGTLKPAANAPGVLGSTPTIQGMTISGGIAEGSFPADAGGGILNDHANLIVQACALTGNQANFGGGLFTAGTDGSAATTLQSTTLSGNNATSVGGAIYNAAPTGGANLFLLNSTLSGNTAGDAGAIYNEGDNASINLFSSTLSGNSGTATGGIVVNDGNLVLGDSILRHGTGANLFSSNGGVIDSLGYNLSDGDDGSLLTGSADQVNTDPILGPLKDNGGPTKTHAPLSNSPAIDRGKDITGSGEGQRGGERPVDYGTGITPPADGDGSDIGAVELAPGVQPMSAVSRKMHGAAGTFDIPLALTGPVSIECRSGGANMDYQIVLTFAAPIAYDDVAVVSGTATIASVSPTAPPATNGTGLTQLTINLTGVANAQRVTLAIFGATDGTDRGDVGLRVGFLLGDVTGDGNVNASDITETKSQTGHAVSSSSFRDDLNANGEINSSDVALAKIKSGTGLP